MTKPLPFPVVDDRETGGYFRAAQQGKIAILFCKNCDCSIHLPRPRCPTCHTDQTEWREVSPTGTIYSWTVVERQSHPAFPVPYTIALVELTEVPGVRLLTHFEGRPELREGMPMTAVFDDRREGNIVLPRWVSSPHIAPSPLLS